MRLTLIISFLLNFNNHVTHASDLIEDHTVNDSYVCKILSYSRGTGLTAKRIEKQINSDVLTPVKKNSVLKINFRTLKNEDRMMTINMERILLDPSPLRPSINLGAKYSYNNPFEPNSILGRNDKTGQTEVTGNGFINEGGVNYISLIDYLIAHPNLSTVNPYHMVYLINPKTLTGDIELKKDENKLISPDGEIVDTILVSCFIIDPRDLDI